MDCGLGLGLRLGLEMRCRVREMRATNPSDLYNLSSTNNAPASVANAGTEREGGASSR